MKPFLSLTILLFLTAAAPAQYVIKLRPPTAAPQPAGVIPPPMLPIPGQPIGRSLPPVKPAPYLAFNPWGFYSGYFPVYPTWEEPQNPRTVINNYFNTPAPAPAPAATTTPVPPPAPVVTTAKLILNVPRGAEVIVSGKKLETVSGRYVVLSPDLKPGQKHLFEVKVTWKDGDKVEERTRQLTLQAGDERSLSYFSGK